MKEREIVMWLPEKIQKLTAGETYQADNIGMSDSSVLLFRDKVLKIQPCGREAETEYRMMLWLRGKLPVPQAFAYEISGQKSYLLMSRCSGRMACDETYMRDPELLVKLLANGLKRLWSVSVADCPADWRLEKKLEQAREIIERGLVDMDNVEPETFGEKGFRDPEALLQWLYDHRPKEELVLSHGDYCLPNLFGEGTEPVGYIDLGKTGVADKWCDIALCYRSLLHNAGGKYCGAAYEGFDGQLLFKELGIEPDWEKIRYYTLLDELF